MAITEFQNFEFLIPKLFFRKTYKKQFLELNGIYVMKTSICYAHAKFWGDPSVFGHKIARKPAKIAYDKTFDCNFWKF